MTNLEHPISFSIVRHDFGTFFDRVRWLYNLAFFKEEKSHKVEDVKRYAAELYRANRISDYIHSIVGEAIEKFTLLLPGKMKKMSFAEHQEFLEKLDAWIDISISDINGEISELMSN